MGVKVDDIRIFEELQAEIKELGEKWREESAKADKKQTFAGIQSTMQNYRFFISNERKMLNESPIYTPLIVLKQNTSVLQLHNTEMEVIKYE